MFPIRVGILTVSDRCSSGETKDISGLYLKTVIDNAKSDLNMVFAERACVPDEIPIISKFLRKWSDDLELELIITTGGTGLTSRDVTPEATKSVIDKEATGISVALLQEGLKHTPMAMLSRPVCGIRNKTLIVNFPGSIQACIDCFAVISPVIVHAVELIRDVDTDHRIHGSPSKCKENSLKQSKSMLNKILSESMENSLKSKVNVEFVANRCRTSPYPLVKFEKARELILDTISPLSTMDVKLRDALGYATYCDIQSKESHPPFDAAMKDGYAVITNDGTGTRIVMDNTLAGEVASSQLKPGYCVRITTGAPIPLGADAVVQVEDTVLVSVDGNDMSEEMEIQILKHPVSGQDIRKIGSDIEKDSILVKSGSVLTSSELGLLATAGITEVTVYRKPKIAVLSTGNELETNSTELSPGKIRDSNKITLLSLLKEHGFDAVDGGIALDEPNDILNKIQSSLDNVDVLITTGGVSMGERDILPDILIEDLKAVLHFGRVNMKPGKPMKFFTVPAKHRPKFVFTLPGNPVSATVTCHLFVLPALRALSGFRKPYPALIKVKTASEVKLDERYEFARATLKWSDEFVVPQATITGNQVSSRMMSMLSADCLLYLPAATDKVKKLPPGEIINAQLMRNFTTD